MSPLPRADGVGRGAHPFAGALPRAAGRQRSCHVIASSNKGLKWIVAGVVAVGSVSALGLTTASAKSPAAGPQVATLAEPPAVPARAKVTAAKHKPAKHGEAHAGQARGEAHVEEARRAEVHKDFKHTAAKGKHKAAGKSHKPSATR